MDKPQKYNLTEKQKRMLSKHKKRKQDTQTVEQSSMTIDSIESLYRALCKPGYRQDKARLMLWVRSWQIQSLEFDPISGQPLNTGIVDFLKKVSLSTHDHYLPNETKDWLYKIVAHIHKAVLAIIKNTRTKILREHALLPIYAVQEVDSTTVRWLSRRPGRNLREKLSGRPYLKAVRRRSSLDTTENRLFKTFLIRLEQILFERQNALSDPPDSVCERLLISISRWLRSESISEIGSWKNIPPNNTLLQDKHYRKIWDGWRWLQAIDEQIQEDYNRLNENILVVTLWKTLSELHLTRQLRIPQQPVNFNYAKCSIATEWPIQGYQFNTNGRIKTLKSDKYFGFITTQNGEDLFFHANDLSPDLNFSSLKVGTCVLFTVGAGKKGKVAQNIYLPPNLPPKISIAKSTNRRTITIGKQTSTLEIQHNHLVIRYFNGQIKTLNLTPSLLEEVPDQILSFLPLSKSKTSLIDNKSDSEDTMSTSIVDLCSIRPEYTNNKGQPIRLSSRLIVQRWTRGDQRIQTLDCGETQTIAMAPNIETISMRELFLPNTSLSIANKSGAALFFIKKLREHIRTDHLIYLIPDWGNDFDLNSIRKNINLYYRSSTPVPKSIATILAWQSSQKFQKNPAQNHDLIFVLDSFEQYISITPVEAVFKKDLKTRLPQSKGIIWERHPSIVLKKERPQENLASALKDMKCENSSTLSRLFGFNGLVLEAGNLSIMSEDDWFHLPKNILKILKRSFSVSLSDKKLHTYSKSLNKNRRAKIFLISENKTIKMNKTEHTWLGAGWSSISGGLALQKWQQQAKEIPLWRDHLPILSMKVLHSKGYTDRFYLVKDATVTPKRGQSVNISTDQRFTLPASKRSYYEFPLQQGEGNKQLRYFAYLKSPAFPLKEEVVCKLKMTYTYGADNPYELTFIPIDSKKAGFQSIQAQWRSTSESKAEDIENIPIPTFPQRKSWSDFQKYPKQDGKSFINLLDRIVEGMKPLRDIKKYKRVSGQIERWIEGKGTLFCFVKDTYIRLPEEQKPPPSGTYISFYKIKTDRGFSGRDITIANETPEKCFLRHLRFPILTVWNHTHSLSEPNAPAHFRTAMQKGTAHAVALLKSEDLPKSLENELFFFLCCLHKDSPPIVANRLLQIVKDKDQLPKVIYRRNIAFAIGDAKLPWQKELFEHIVRTISKNNNHTNIIILSIALWRSEDLIHLLCKKEIENLCCFLLKNLISKTDKIDGFKNNKDHQTKISRLLWDLCKYLECLLALLRARGSTDENIRSILAIKQKRTKQFKEQIDKISKIVVEKKLKLRPRINLQIEKPPAFAKTPDLLYALRMYLTGDSGADSIFITSISDE
ncbi:MAG: hypothetical protein CMK59_14155 [Proteobacteria bacterium]|nr:hypothetical protein [Pseudomonadota bacterium]